jgi:hypothetical protein
MRRNEAAGGGAVARGVFFQLCLHKARHILISHSQLDFLKELAQIEPGRSETYRKSRQNVINRWRDFGELIGIL